MQHLREALAQCAEDQSDPRERLKQLPSMQQVRDVHRYGCPYGTLTAELGKDDADRSELISAAFAVLLEWTEAQYRALAPDDDAVRSVGEHLIRLQGAAVLAHAFGDPSIIAQEVEALPADVDRL